jgi:hypothetical protein
MSYNGKIKNHEGRIKMTAIRMSDAHKELIAKVDIWPCKSCRRVHMRAGDLLLTFDATEFSEFAESVVACYTQHKLHEEECNSINVAWNDPRSTDLLN